MYKYILSIIFLATTVAELRSQVLEVPSSEKPNDWFLTFQWNTGINGFSTCYKSRYEGEYLDQNVWTWKEETTTRCDWFRDYSQKVYDFVVTLSFIENLNVGIKYNVILLTNGALDIWDSDRRKVFFNMAGVVEYDYFPKKDKGFFIRPSIAIGNYQSSEEYSGVGMELYTEAKMNLGYRVGGRLEFKWWLAYNGLFYRESTNSQIFDREEKIQLDWNFIHHGIGFSYRIFMLRDED